MPDCSILTNHGQSQAPAVVCDGCYRLAITSIQEGENEIDRLQALERTAWADYQACAAERDSLTLDLHSARQMVTDTHAALDEAENRLFGEQQATGRAELGREKAEARVAELEALLARHEHPTTQDSCGPLCPECSSYRDDGWRPARPPHTPGCPWGQAAANHRARQTGVADAV